MTFFCASLKIQERKNLWQDLEPISSMTSEAWIIIGDFNAYYESSEKWGEG